MCSYTYACTCTRLPYRPGLWLSVYNMGKPWNTTYYYDSSFVCMYTYCRRWTPQSSTMVGCEMLRNHVEGEVAMIDYKLVWLRHCRNISIRLHVNTAQFSLLNTLQTHFCVSVTPICQYSKTSNKGPSKERTLALYVRPLYKGHSSRSQKQYTGIFHTLGTSEEMIKGQYS